jgi:hypothetical protein
MVLMMPKGFTEMLKAALDIMLNPRSDLTQVEMKVAPAFAVDNYILPKIQKQPRIQVTNTKGISTYAYQDTEEMIRFGDAVYEEMQLKGKNAVKYPAALTNAIKATVGYAGSDYVFLRQDARDVLHDHNYKLQLVTQVAPYPILRGLPFTNFIDGNFHYLFHEKDTVAVFSIQRSVADHSKKIAAFKVYNGFDTASTYTLPGKDITWDVIYDYVVRGKLGQQNFSINSSGFGNTVKEIFLNDKLVCIAQGKFSPERFVVFDASLSPDLLKQFFMIGFNRFFQ